MNIGETESAQLEFKREIPKKEQILNTVIGFCNLYGGKLIVGVEDDGTVVGVDETQIDHVSESLHQSIYKAIDPHIFPKIYSQRLGDRLILVIEISEGANKPYYRASAGIDNGTYIRLGQSTVKATPEIIQELQWQGKGKYHDEIPVYHASPQELDEQLILTFLHDRKHGHEGTVDDSLLTSYKLLVSGQTRLFPTVGGLLLFGKDPQKYLTESFIICSHFKGVSGYKAIATVDCTGNLFQQIDQALQFVFSRLYRSYVIQGLRRIEKLEIPEIAVREVIINAIVHRNYSIRGAIKIAIYEDRVEVFSPGVFPGPLDVNNLERGISYIRNVVITRIFRESGVMEKLGSGFISLFSSYREAGLEKPSVIEGLNYVKCVLPRKKRVTDSADRVSDGQTDFRPAVGQPAEGLPDDAIILELFQNSDQITMNTVLKRTGWARATAGRRLKSLVDKGRLVKIGGARYCHYRLAERRE